MPRPGYRLGVRAGATRWRVALDTDAPDYGGSGYRSDATALRVEAVPAHGHAQSLVVDLPPLATLFLLPVAAGDAADDSVPLR
jgi:1,4-alpha-glucan branching enzyme